MNRCFYCSALKMTKCQTLKKFWHFFDEICYVIWHLFLGRNSEKTPCMCKYNHTCMCVATGKVNGSHWRIMIFIWLLSSVPPLFPRLAALWPPVLSPLPPYYFPPSTEGQRRAIRVREEKEERCKRSKRSKMTQQQWPRAASEAVAVACFWGLWRPLKAACISRTYRHRCCRCY